MAKKTSFTFKLNQIEQKNTLAHLKTDRYQARPQPYTDIAVDGPNCKISLFTSGKLLIQGKGAEEWITFTLEPEVLQKIVIGHDSALDPSQLTPHMGIDESGKGDFFGPLVIAAVYTDEKIVAAFRELDVKDSKAITSDNKMLTLASGIRKILGNRFAIVTIGPAAYNKLYTSMSNLNNMLAWGHARAIEDLLDKVPDCPRALSDQFGPKSQIEKALLKKGRSIKLEQRPKAESDLAVAAASILARAAFVWSLKKMGEELEMEIPKGVSAKVKDTSIAIVNKLGPEALIAHNKCHFKTTDEILEKTGFSRDDLGPHGQAKSKSFTRYS